MHNSARPSTPTANSSWTGSNLNGGGDAYATPDGTFVFGDSASPSTTYAFSMTNQLASSRAFDVAINNLAPSGADP